jgi:hypothetical protein
MIHHKGDEWWAIRKPGVQSEEGARLSFERDAEKRPSAALLSSFIVAA